jgi:hypothetical protein
VRGGVVGGCGGLKFTNLLGHKKHALNSNTTRRLIQIYLRSDKAAATVNP